MITNKVKRKRNVEKKQSSQNNNEIYNKKDIILSFSEPKNYINLYVGQMYKTNMDLLNGSLLDDINLLLSGSAYYPNLVCKTNDMAIFDEILKEIKNNEDFELKKWNQHYKIENPEISNTFNMLCHKMAEHLKIRIIKTRLNYYKDSSDWKTYHKDSHAYSTQLQLSEDYTFGISLGATRSLSFKHENTGNILTFPQNNGDVFAFDNNVNKKFLHGIPKTAYQSGPRISVIVWGKKLI